MNSELLDQEFSKYKFKVEEFLKDLHQLVIEINAQEIQDTISNLRGNINEPFLFVVVGEVKAGKSSFINALLGDEICKVGPEPVTDVVQKIEYGENKNQQKLNSYIVKKFHPSEILKSIAIVDTPGTNTIIENHQEITKRYIPNSDLVFFVFPAKNPHTKTAWDLLSFVSDEWRKNVIFILQQADLTTSEELSKNEEKVKEYALKYDVNDPTIFSVSAKWENQGYGGESGFSQIKQFIRNKITGGDNYFIKLNSILGTSESVIVKVEEHLKSRRELFEEDRKVVEQIKKRLNAGEKQSQYEIEKLVERIIKSYENIAEQIYSEFEEGLSLLNLFSRSIKGVFNKGESIEEWLDTLQEKFKEKTEETIIVIAKDGAAHFISGIKDLLESLIFKLDKLENNQPQDTQLFLKTMEKRNVIIDDIKEKLINLLDESELGKLVNSGPQSIRSNFAMGGALAVIGSVIMAATQIAVLDITGGILASIGVMVAGIVTLIKRRKIKKEFRNNLFDAKNDFREELRTKLESNLEIIYEEIDRHFVELYKHVEDEEKKIGPLINRLEDIEQRQIQLSNDIENSFHS